MAKPKGVKRRREQLQSDLVVARTSLAVVVSIFALITIALVTLGYWTDNPLAFLITVVIAIALSGILYARQRALVVKLNRRTEITPEAFNKSLE